MSIVPPNNDPLITVIIPCYNHGRYISKAIESVLAQNYSNTEIIVVDDGSQDETSDVVKSYPTVRYHLQNNSGLSASRNKGIDLSNGKILVFLDSDDWLYQNALQVNLGYLQKNKHAAFVSGAYEKVFEPENIIKEESRIVESHHYENLLRHGNFITVPAAVMYNRWVFDEFRFDETLKVCEDFDLYLKVSRKYPIVHHTEKIAAYRRHESNMSSNDRLIMEVALSVLNKQKDILQNEEEKAAFKKGQDKWKSYYCNEIYKKLKAKSIRPSVQHVTTLLKYRPKYFIKYLLTGM